MKSGFPVFVWGYYATTYDLTATFNNYFKHFQIAKKAQKCWYQLVKWYVAVYRK